MTTLQVLQSRDNFFLVSFQAFSAPLRDNIVFFGRALNRRLMLTRVRIAHHAAAGFREAIAALQTSVLS